MSATRILLVHPKAERMTGEIAAAVQGVGKAVELTVADTSDEAIAAAAHAEILMAFFTTERLLGAAPRLRWIQALGSGVDGFLRWPSLRRDVFLTSAAGLHSAPVSEAILTMMLALARGLPASFRDQQAHRWGGGMPRLLAASEVLVIGVGKIGAAFGARCAALGSKVVGLSGRSDRPDGFSAIYPATALRERLAQADFVVLTAPFTPGTAPLIDAAALARMKPTAYLVNAARGGLIDDAALVAALRSNQIAGAALDVFTAEPLPNDSPYWDLPNVIITPHRAGYYEDYGKDVGAIVVGNLHHYLAGRFDKLVNRIR